MHSTWFILLNTQSAVVVVYCVLCVVTARRSRGRVKKTAADKVFWLIIVLIGIRIFVPFVFGYGLAYRFAVILAGVAAAIGILFEMRALTTLRQDEQMKSS